MAAKQPHTIKKHVDARVDNYYWLRDDERQNPEMLAYLTAENAYVDAVMKRLKPLEDRLYDEIVGRIKQAEAGLPIKGLCRKGGFSDATFYKWRAKYGGMDVPDTRRLRELEGENAKLQKLLAEEHLDIHALNTAYGVKR